MIWFAAFYLKNTTCYYRSYERKPSMVTDLPIPCSN